MSVRDNGYPAHLIPLVHEVRKLYGIPTDVAEAMVMHFTTVMSAYLADKMLVALKGMDVQEYLADMKEVIDGTLTGHTVTWMLLARPLGLQEETVGEAMVYIVHSRVRELIKGLTKDKNG